jgi:bifunctional enzyme CysN/CysC
MTEIEEFLKRNQESDVLRFTTAGSVDDGKSTLIGRLLSDCKCIYEDQLAALTADSKRLNREEVDLALLTDGLKAEREQGITIDVAYRYFSTPRRRFIIADTPGHEQYTRNMATGASTADLAVILIDARLGVLTQSRRHGFIASLLGIPHVVVCVNKMDLAGYSEEVFQEIRKSYSAFTARLNLPDVHYLPISALRGDNVVQRSARMPWYDGPTLLAHLEGVETGSRANLIDFRFPVQLVNRPNLNFRGYCGTVASGVVRVGDEVAALPSGTRTRVKSIETFDGPLEAAFAGQAVTLCLADERDISRGDMLCRPNNLPHVTQSTDAMVVWMSESPLRQGVPYLIKHTTQTVRGTFPQVHYRVDPDTLSRVGSGALGLNDIGRVTLETYRPLCWDAYAKNRATGAFIVIDPLTHATVGAGMITDRIVQKAEGVPVSRNIMAEAGLVTEEERQALLRQRPATLWMTGLSGSGKSSVAKALEKRLVGAGHAVAALDGDNVRHGLNRDLGFSAEDRAENLRRVAEVCALMNGAGLLVVTSFISPMAEDRTRARRIIGEERFLEVFVDAPVETCERRDPKGLYKKARAGEIPSFTGISAPFEAPEKPDVRLDTTACTPEAAADCLFEELRGRGFLQG